MGLEIQDALEAAFQEVDSAEAQLDESAVRDPLARAVHGLEHPNASQRKGNFALVSALDFQHRRLSGPPAWDMYWQPLSAITDQAGREHVWPDVTQVDEEVIREWIRRAGTVRNPVLRARYADLAWELAKFRRGQLTGRPDVTMARTASDSYVEAVERGLFSDELFAWIYIGRSLALAISINDANRVQFAKRALFAFQAGCEARGLQYAFLRFDEIASSHANALELTDADRTVIVQALEHQLALRSNRGEPQLFDPHLARAAADCLARWREDSGEKAEAARAARTAGAAFEAAAAQASGLVAIAWLSEQAVRYRRQGDREAVARVERAIRDRAGDAQGEMKRISIPLNVTPEEVDAWADRMAGGSLEAGLQGFAAAGLIGRTSTERAVLDIAAQAPLSAHIPITLAGADGFAKAVIGSVDEDLDGRTVHHAAQVLSQRAPFLNVAWRRLQEKHAVDLERLTEWLSHCPLFPASRLRFVREGLQAFFVGDHIKVVHILVPQVEAALRDLLAALNVAVTRQDESGAFQMILLGEILNHERFKAKVPDDIRFHFQVLYQDHRGLNVRNELAHGIAAFELFGLGLANMVVHSIIVIGLLRLQQRGPGDGAPQAAPAAPAE